MKVTVNGRRRFVSNTGKRYYVIDMCKQDIRGEEKYNLEVEKDGKHFKDCVKRLGI